MATCCVPLRSRSNYSLLTGTATVDALAAKAARLGYGALALTDRNGIYGAVPFFAAAERHGLKAILEAGKHYVVVARMFPADEPGYGFVDEQTPELTIAIVPSMRGRGLGRELLEALLVHAREDGFERVSLSVEPDNDAIRLYEQHGFVKSGERAGALVMLATLA